MLKIIVDSAAILGIVAVLFSPAIVFRAIDKYLFRENDSPILGRDIFNEPLDIDVSYGGSIFNRADTIDRDEKILTNLTLMAERGENPEVQTIWRLKKLEFERRLHWLATMTYAKGHETLPVV